MVARFQNDPQQEFNRNWEDYKKGFGDPSAEHWIGKYKPGFLLLLKKIINYY